MEREEKIKTLLVSMLKALADATYRMEIADTDYGIVHIPILRWCPSFEFTVEDIQLIKSLAEETMKDFSTLTES